jgi:hypothetical protein
MGGYSVESNIENTSHYILNQIIEKRSEILTILIDCASKLPEKITIYSTLIGLLNSQNPNFVEDVTDFDFLNFCESLYLLKFIFTQVSGSLGDHSEEQSQNRTVLYRSHNCKIIHYEKLKNKTYKLILYKKNNLDSLHLGPGERASREH